MKTERLRLWAEQVRVLLFPRRCPFCGRVLGFLTRCPDCEPELKMKDFRKYRSYYCGLCQELKEKSDNCPTVNPCGKAVHVKYLDTPCLII